jgi:hypothetical protein
MRRQDGAAEAEAEVAIPAAVALRMPWAAEWAAADTLAVVGTLAVVAGILAAVECAWAELPISAAAARISAAGARISAAAARE